MKSLIIIANPSKTSFAHAVADAYKQWAIEVGKEVEILDLYDTNQAFLSYKDTASLKKWEINSDPNRAVIQSMIKECDEMVYIFPVWWGSIPAILKNFFDTNFGAWFAFEFVQWSNKQKKLLIDKTAKVFTHCDAPAFVYQRSFVWGINIKNYISRLILWFCGVKLIDYKIFGKLRDSSKEKRNAHLEAVKKSGTMS